MGVGIDYETVDLQLDKRSTCINANSALKLG
ncbi:uncharacterized protein METZ01_LOCUS449126, partial [marine metagenome]